MKKLISMMLMLCAFITFSACSSDDDGPTNPVSAMQWFQLLQRLVPRSQYRVAVSLLVRLFISSLSRELRLTPMPRCLLTVQPSPFLTP